MENVANTNKYIGVKIVDGWPITENEFRQNRGGPLVANDRDGYGVRYEDGYESWCPKRQFLEANRPTDAMPFGHAIEAVKLGKKISRKGWNGKNMFVFLREGRKITGVDANSPMGGDFESLPHLCMRAADGKCVVGWLASQTDILSEDWFIFGESGVI